MVRVKSTWTNQANRRGQAVLLAAFVLAVALLPIIAAYLQVGYGGESAVAVDEDRQREARHLLERAVQEQASAVDGRYRWRQRDAAVERLRAALEPTARQLPRSRLDEGVVQQFSYNQSHAARWAGDRCPSGPNRQFGRCDTFDGVVVQDRAGRTHILAVAVDISLTTPNGNSTLTTVIRVQAG